MTMMLGQIQQDVLELFKENKEKAVERKDKDLALMIAT
jgi:hypothetical protein